jgi:adenosylcobinamide-GDP ribazoletransferase
MSVIVADMSAPDHPSRLGSGFLARFLVVTAFLTRLPINRPADDAWQLADSVWAFPLVGAGIGAIAAFVFLLAQLLGLGDWPAALLSILSGLAVTGAFHEDGLADTADGFFAGHDRDATLAIMRDSRQGTFGVVAIVLSVLLRAAALASIGDAIHAGLALVTAHTVSRAALPVAMSRMVPARSDGLGAAAGRPRPPSVVAALSIGVLVGLAALGPVRGVFAICLTGIVLLAAAGLARRRIGGYTGDVLGAFQQIGEIVMLLAASAA